MEAKQEKRAGVGVAVILIREGKVLLGKRQGSHGSQCWGFPGGHIHYGESIEDCARRELLEETGLTLGGLQLGPYTNDIFTEEEKHYITLFVLSDYVGGEAELKEPEKCSRWEWFSWNELPRPLFLPIRNLLKQGYLLPSPSASANQEKESSYACR